MFGGFTKAFAPSNPVLCDSLEEWDGVGGGGEVQKGGDVFVCVSRSLCQLLCDPMDHSLPGSSVHGISQARILEWVAGPPPGDLPDWGSALGLLHCRQFLPSEPRGKPRDICMSVADS